MIRERINRVTGHWRLVEGEPVGLDIRRTIAGVPRPLEGERFLLAVSSGSQVASAESVISATAEGDVAELRLAWAEIEALSIRVGLSWWLAEVVDLDGERSSETLFGGSMTIVPRPSTPISPGFAPPPSYPLVTLGASR